MKTLKITLLLCLITFILKAQTVHTVDNRSQSGAMFTDLQAAIDAATSGDIIHIHPSETTYGNVTIGKTLTLVGLGHNPVTHNQGLTANVNAIGFFGTAAGSKINGLTIGTINQTGGTANNLDGIHLTHNRISAINGGSSNGISDFWIIEGNYITSTSTAINTGASGWLIKNNFMLGGVRNLNVTNLVTNNIFFSTSNSSDFFFTNCTSIIISNNIFITNGNMTEFGISSSTNLDFRNNLTYSYVGNTIVDLPGTGNLNNTNPMFEIAPVMDEDDFYNNNYQLMASSPGANYGTDGTDIGIFGNNFLFDNQGRPDVMPYPTSLTINNNVVAPNQDLNVNFTAEQKQ